MVTKKIEYVEYDVEGSTHTEVAAALTHARDTRPELRGFDAYTDPYVVLEQTDLGGGLVQSRAWLRVDVHVPRLAPGAPADVAECFAKYRAAIDAHEGLHIRSAELAFSKLHNWMIRGGRSAQEVRDRIDELKRRFDARSLELDERTNHGAPDCDFPPPGCPHA